MKYVILLLVIVLISGCTTPANVDNSTVRDIISEVSDSGLNKIYEDEFFSNKKAFIGATSNELYDMEVRLTGAGHINISENNKVDEYFRINFNVTNHANRDMTFPYEANISEDNPKIKVSSSDKKRPSIGTLKPNETKDGYVLFKNYRTQNNIIELMISGGYRQYSSNSINFRFKIDFRNESSVFLERALLDFSEEGNTIHPGGFLLVKILSNGTYRYILTSDRNVSVDIWPPDTKVNTIQFGNSTINSTCSIKLQKSVSRECFLEKNYLITIKRTTNIKTQDFEGATVSFYLFRVFTINDTSSVLKYTGQTTYDTLKNEEVFVVL